MRVYYTVQNTRAPSDTLTTHTAALQTQRRTLSHTILHPTALQAKRRIICVYILRSLSMAVRAHRLRTYVGFTVNPRRRLKQVSHLHGCCSRVICECV
jgi:hypothetical protein